MGPLAWLIWGVQERKLLSDDEVQKPRLSVVESPTERLKQVLDEATWVVADDSNQLYVLPSPETLLESDLFPEGAELEGDAPFKQYFLPITEEAEAEHAVLVTDPSKFYRSLSLVDRRHKHSTDKHRRSLSEGGQIIEETVSVIKEREVESELQLPIVNESLSRPELFTSNAPKNQQGSDVYLSPDSSSQGSSSLFGSQTSIELVTPKPEIINEEINVASIASYEQFAIPNFEKSMRSYDGDFPKVEGFGGSFRPVSGEFKPLSANDSAHDSPPDISLNSQNDASFTSLAHVNLKSSPHQKFTNINVSTVSDDDEDDEIHSAFTSLHRGTRIHVSSNNETSKIHSIDVKPEQGATRMHIRSPVMRIKTSKARVESESPVHILSIHQDDDDDDEIDKTHLVVNTQTPEYKEGNVHSHEHIKEPLKESIVNVELQNQDYVDGKPAGEPKVKVELIDPDSNGNFQLRDSKVTLKKTPDQLAAERVMRGQGHSVERPAANLSEFEKIMQRRKKYTDVMYNAGNIIGQIAHRDDKVDGRAKKLSPNWLKIKQCVKSKAYLKYKRYVIVDELLQ